MPLLGIAAPEPVPSIGEDAAEDRADSEPELGRRPTLDAVLKAARDAIIIFDTEATIRECNSAAEHLLDLTREQLIGADLVELIFPDRLRQATRGVIEARGAGWSGPSPRAIEVAVVNGSGGEIPVEMTLSWSSDTALFAAHLRDSREQGERERELAAEARRRTRLLELGQLALGQSGLDALIQRALATTGEEVGLASCEVWDYDAETEELCLRHSSGHATAPETRVRPAAGSALAKALTAGERSVLTGDRLLPSPWLAAEQITERAPAGVAVILPGADAVLGALTGTGTAGRQFSSADTTFLASIAQILASAIERERVNRSLASAETRLRTLVERLPAITYRAGLGTRGRWHYVSPQVEEVLGISPEDCAADNFWWEKRVHPDDIGRVIAAEDRAAADGKPLDIEYRMTARDGRQLWIRDRAAAGVRQKDGEVIADGLMSDVTVRRNAEDRLRHLADHDHLTDLLNRRGFEESVDRLLNRMPAGTKGALAIIDIDHLKLVNDSRGHAAGDALLREIAAATKVSLRADDIFGRLSGDEFGLFIPEINESTAWRRLGDLIELVRQSRRGGFSITASAGAVVVDGGHDLKAADLLIHADVALYRAKEGGRDRVVFAEPEENEQMTWLAEIREAVEDRRLALFAQPIYDLETGAHHASELLVRMVARDGQTVAASHFIPTAERFGLIAEVDHWVLRRAVAAAARGMRVSVNLSASSIADSGLTEMVADEIKAHNADASRLIFEITETAATPTVELLREFAQRVDSLGCGLALDDAGTGFGTLTYLQNLSFTHLKIDMAFVQRMMESKNDRAIVRSLVTIARELELVTVAEGVESAETLAELRRLGVNYAQGYFLGEPRPLDPLKP